jgi:hypothetical protein
VSSPSDDARETVVEIVVDRDGVEPEPEPDREWTGRLRQLTPPNSVLAVAAVLLLVAAAVLAVVKYAGDRETAAEALVRSFLEAVRAGDVDAALAMTDFNGTAPIHDPAVLDDRWEIVEVAQVAHPEDSVVEVYAEIRAYDGTSVADRLLVDLASSRPVLKDALTRAEWHTTTGNPVVNGVEISYNGDPQYRLLPGVYEFAERVPPTLNAEPVEMVALGHALVEFDSPWSSVWVPGSSLTITSIGRERVQAGVLDYLDDCVASLNSGEYNLSCPVGPIASLTVDDDSMTIESDSGGLEAGTWTIVDYPEVALEELSWGGMEFPLVTLEPGTAEVQLADGPTVLRCPIWMDGASAEFHAGGSVEIRWGAFFMELATPGCPSFTRAD